MRKKVIGFTSVLLATSVVMTACSGSGGGGNAEDGASTDPAGSGKKVKLTAIMTKHPLTKPLAEMEWLQKVEDKAGVEIEWQEITADWGQKKERCWPAATCRILFVGPNVITDADFAQFQGLFQDLSGMLDQAPNVQKMFEEKPDTKRIATQPDGKIYGLPKYQRFWPSSASRLYINQKWLDNLGLKVPNTWDELYDVLVAFKEKDANGNGDPNDEIPMDWPGGIGGYFNAAYLLGGTGMTLTDGSPEGYFVEDGQVKNYLIDERYKSLVMFLNKLYKAGLINPEVFTHDYTKYQSVARGEGDGEGRLYAWLGRVRPVRREAGAAIYVDDAAEGDAGQRNLVELRLQLLELRQQPYRHVGHVETQGSGHALHQRIVCAGGRDAGALRVDRSEYQG
ncbi:extracellular solute-binding protein [Paenibacillus sp. JTLBN-2024]